MAQIACRLAQRLSTLLHRRVHLDSLRDTLARCSHSSQVVSHQSGTSVDCDCGGELPSNILSNLPVPINLHHSPFRIPQTQGRASSLSCLWLWTLLPVATQYSMLASAAVSSRMPAPSTSRVSPPQYPKEAMADMCTLLELFTPELPTRLLRLHTNTRTRGDLDP